MKLSEIVQRLDAFDDDATIIAAKPWASSSRAQVIEPPESGLATEMERDGMVYFLEIAIAREFKEDWPSEQGEAAFCERLIQYAINDA
ncbi:hypothetical protein [Terricaulis sp.]